MKIRISEVWNSECKSRELAVITVDTTPGKQVSNLCHQAVRSWISGNRPDLILANGIYSHGYHAIAIC